MLTTSDIRQLREATAAGVRDVLGGEPGRLRRDLDALVRWALAARPSAEVGCCCNGSGASCIVCDMERALSAWISEHRHDADVAAVVRADLEELADLPW